MECCNQGVSKGALVHMIVTGVLEESANRKVSVAKRNCGMFWRRLKAGFGQQVKRGQMERLCRL
jgi:hypothetical protein